MNADQAIGGIFMISARTACADAAHRAISWDAIDGAETGQRYHGISVPNQHNVVISRQEKPVSAAMKLAMREASNTPARTNTRSRPRPV